MDQIDCVTSSRQFNILGNRHICLLAESYMRRWTRRSPVGPLNVKQGDSQLNVEVNTRQGARCEQPDLGQRLKPHHKNPPINSDFLESLRNSRESERLHYENHFKATNHQL